MSYRAVPCRAVPCLPCRYAQTVLWMTPIRLLTSEFSSYMYWWWITSRNVYANSK